MRSSNAVETRVQRTVRGAQEYPCPLAMNEQRAIQSNRLRIHTHGVLAVMGEDGQRGTKNGTSPLTPTTRWTCSIRGWGSERVFMGACSTTFDPPASFGKACPRPVSFGGGGAGAPRMEIRRVG